MAFSSEDNRCMLTQIVEITENDALVLNTSALAKILLNEGCRDKFPIIISIAGEFHSGKSSTLDVLAHHLRTRNNVEPAAAPLHRDGTHKRGIFLTKEPLTGRNDEAVVFLMDTSGLLDGFNRSSSAKMFAISLLMSSVQIFNVMGRLNSGMIDYLQYLIEFTRFSFNELLLQENHFPNLLSQLPPLFGQLAIFIRDWSLHGETGGQDLLSDWLHKMPDFAQCLENNFNSQPKCFTFPNFGEQSLLRQELIIATESLICDLNAKKLVTLSDNGPVAAPITCQELFHFTLNLVEYFQLTLDTDEAITTISPPRLSHLSLHELASEVDLQHLRGQLTRLYREMMQSFEEEINNGSASISELDQRHNCAKELILTALRKNNKLGQNQDRIEKECIEIAEELDELHFLFASFSSTWNAQLKDMFEELKNELAQAQKSQAPAQQKAASTPVEKVEKQEKAPSTEKTEKLKLQKVLPRKCCWQSDEYLYSDGTICQKYGISVKGSRYKEAWGEFKKLTFSGLENQLGIEGWFSLPYRILTKNPKSYVCSSPSRRLMSADAVIM